VVYVLDGLIAVMMYCISGIFNMAASKALSRLSGEWIVLIYFTLSGLDIVEFCLLDQSSISSSILYFIEWFFECVTNDSTGRFSCERSTRCGVTRLCS